MRLSKREQKVVESVCPPAVREPTSCDVEVCRTFHDVNLKQFNRLVAGHADHIGNEIITRLPELRVFQEFLSEYPFFTVNGFIHNLGSDNPVQLFITGIEFVSRDETHLGLGGFDVDGSKKQFTEAFHTADYLLISEGEVAAEYYLDRSTELR